MFRPLSYPPSWCSASKLLIGRVSNSTRSSTAFMICSCVVTARRFEGNYRPANPSRPGPYGWPVTSAPPLPYPASSIVGCFFLFCIHRVQLYIMFVTISNWSHFQPYSSNSSIQRISSFWFWPGLDGLRHNIRMVQPTSVCLLPRTARTARHDEVL